LQQLLLAEGLLQLLALIDGADHGKQGEGVAVLVIERHLVDLHPAGAFAAVAVQLLVQQGLPSASRRPSSSSGMIAPGHLGIVLPMSSLGLQAGLPGECLVGKQVPSGRIPAEDIHG
jgi:hypothetical protein